MVRGWVDNIRVEDVLWWQLVAFLIDGGAKHARELAKCFLAAWQWTFEVCAANFCLPAPTMLNIGQFLDEEPEEGDHAPWLLAYAYTLQCVGEAAEGRRCCPSGMHFSLQVSLLVDAFIMEMGWSSLSLESLHVGAGWQWRFHCKSRMDPLWT